MGGALASNYAANNQLKLNFDINVPFVGSQTIGLANFTFIPVLWDFYLRFLLLIS